MRRLKSLLWPVIAACSIGWLTWRVGLQELGTALAGIRPLPLALLVIANFGFALLFALRWWTALRALGYRLGYFSIFRSRTAAFAVSYLTPGSQFGGEPLQVMALRRMGIPLAAAVASVTLDKLFELLANFSFIVFGVAFMLQTQSMPGLSPWRTLPWAGVLLSLPVIHLVLLWNGRAPLTAVLNRLISSLPFLHWLQNLRPAAVHLSDAEAHITILLQQQPVTILRLALASAVIWAATMLDAWLTAWAFGPALTPPELILVITAARLAFLAPVPAGLGALEAGQILAFQAIGVDPAVGLAVALWIRLRDACLAGLGLAFSAALFSGAVPTSGAVWAPNAVLATGVVRSEQTYPTAAHPAGE